MLKAYQIRSNDDPMVTFDLLRHGQIFVRITVAIQWKDVAWHLQICNGCFTQVSELWPMGLLFVFSLRISFEVINIPTWQSAKCVIYLSIIGKFSKQKDNRSSQFKFQLNFR